MVEVLAKPLPTIELYERPTRIIVLPPRCLEGEALEDEVYGKMFTPEFKQESVDIYRQHVNGCRICQERENAITAKYRRS